MRITIRIPADYNPVAGGAGGEDGAIRGRRKLMRRHRSVKSRKYIFVFFENKLKKKTWLA